MSVYTNHLQPRIVTDHSCCTRNTTTSLAGLRHVEPEIQHIFWSRGQSSSVPDAVVQGLFGTLVSGSHWVLGDVAARREPKLRVYRCPVRAPSLAAKWSPVAQHICLCVEASARHRHR